MEPHGVRKGVRTQNWKTRLTICSRDNTRASRWKNFIDKIDLYIRKTSIDR